FGDTGQATQQRARTLNTTRPETFTEVRREHPRQQQVDITFGIGGQEEGDPAAGTVQGSSSSNGTQNEEEQSLHRQDHEGEIEHLQLLLEGTTVTCCCV
ncbi:unnamed protein product, partial [Pylaiella littoralis]